jgi:hypothetical protein
MTNALTRYKAINSNNKDPTDVSLDGLPGCIVIYRDGVGDGQVIGMSGVGILNSVNWV